MANQPTIKKILGAAHAQNLLFPSAEENKCLIGYVNTANYLLFLLKQAEGQGLDNEQINKRSGFHINTIKIYMRVLVSLGYVTRSEASNRSPTGEGGLKAVWALKKQITKED